MTTDCKFSNYKFSGGTPEQLEGLVGRLAKTVPECAKKPPIDATNPNGVSEEAIRKAAKEKADADEKVVKEMKEADEKAAKDIKEVAEKKKQASEEIAKEKAKANAKIEADKKKADEDKR